MIIMNVNNIQTVVAVFIKNNELLMEERENNRKVYAGFLMCPSGHIQNNESFEQAIKREMNEELGIKIKKSRFLFSINDKDPFSKKNFTHNFMLIESFQGNITNSQEAKKLKWMTYKELKNEKLVLIVDKLVERLHEMNLL
ncbi:hypothetical protein DRH29_03605 [candidate division Kazan bacterium]|uniref:8-oxo-dGTP diphosphatase n=1 Tax=candidate division Kazan bacterium TaxID=2202143 RepID=A0A420ZC48_UNCK3|nr:MAG: hypothetical protein DRH29_03605 [candidate division Kazan bacterium]